MGGVIFFFYLIYFESPKEKALQRELEIMASQFEMLSAEASKLDEILKDMEQRDDNVYRVIFESDPIPSSIRRAGSGGVNKYENLKFMTSAELITETNKKIEELSKAIYIQSKSYDEIEKLAQNKIDMLAAIPAIVPVPHNTNSVRQISSGYGYRIHPLYKISKFHSGMDFTGTIGTPVHATGNGVVESCTTDKGYGKYVVVNHGYNYKTVYAHLNKINVKKGQTVKRGDVIGEMGNTGQSTAPHLHYEVRKNDRPVDPVNFYFNDLTPEEYDDFVTAASNTGQSMD